MTLLAVDIGNSKTAAAALAGGRVTEHGPRGDPAAALRWCVGRAQAGDIASVAVASVVPASTSWWRAQWQAATGGRDVPLMVIDAATPKPYGVHIARPESVGADRWCNVAGAWARGYRNALVADLGTANTYDVLADGIFEGGLIAPGIATAHEALLRGGARLPHQPFGPATVWIGRTTEEAIAGGSWHQGVGGVGYVLAQLRAVQGQPPVLLTGGLASLAAGALPFSTEILPDLTLEGAAVLASGSQ